MFKRLFGRPHPVTDPGRAWLIATSAVLTEANKGRHDTLLHSTSLTRPPRLILSSSWDVRSAPDALQTTEWLLQEGHRTDYEEDRKRLMELFGPDLAGPGRDEIHEDPARLIGPDAAEMPDEDLDDFRTRIRTILDEGAEHESIEAWDLCRAASVVRWSADAGFVTEDEAWTYLGRIGRGLQESFGSWADVGRNYEFGRRIWAGAPSPQMSAVLGRLLDPDNYESPWVRLPWDTPLPDPA